MTARFAIVVSVCAAGIVRAQEPTADSVRKLLDTGKYAGAEAGARRLLAAAENGPGAVSREAADALNILLVALAQQGKFDSHEALEVARRNLELREKVYGPGHTEVASALNALGGLYIRLGRDDEGRPLLERALAIYERSVDRDSLKAFAAWNNLGWLLTNIGDYPEAIRSYARSLAIAERNSDTTRIASALNGQAIAYRHMNEYAKARANYERSVALYEKQFGPEHERVAAPLNNLGQLFLITGDPQRAKELFARALEICEKALGPGSYRAADMLAGLGMSEANTGGFEAARPLLERAVAIRRQYQAQSAELAGTESELATLLSRTGDFSGALDAALEAESISRQNLELMARILPERQVLDYASTRVRGLDLAISLMSAQPSVPRARLMDALIRSRALVFDEMAARHRVVHASLDASLDSGAGDELLRLSQELTTSREQLSTLLVAGSGAQVLAEAARRKERAESALAEHSISFRQELAGRRAGLAEVAAALGPRTALVSFVRYDRTPVQRTPSGRVFDIEPVPSYIAMVLRQGSADPVAIPLGPAVQIDAMVEALRKQVATEASAPGESPKRSEGAYRTDGEALRRRIWDPLTSAIGAAAAIFVVPDGSIHLVNFAALPVGSAEYLVDRGPLIHYLSAERDLLPVTAPIGTGLLALGDPAFGANEEAAAAAKTVYRGASSSCAKFASMRFEPLPESARETDTIASLWRKGADLGEVSQLRRSAAGEGAFKREAPGKRVLHLATHGFFLGGCPSALDSASVRGENPLLLSGLALAGANLRHTNAGRSEDGILTAEEIAAMDLSGVEWAVLSACETGLGELKDGEGVFGLRRAFQVAGARTVIMSLWPVDDSVTRQWMTTLYGERFLKHHGTAEAVREADLSSLRRLRAAGHSTHPFYWAAFLAAGDWR